MTFIMNIKIFWNHLLCPSSSTSLSPQPQPHSWVWSGYRDKLGYRARVALDEPPAKFLFCQSDAIGSWKDEKILTRPSGHLDHVQWWLSSSPPPGERIKLNLKIFTARVETCNTSTNSLSSSTNTCTTSQLPWRKWTKKEESRKIIFLKVDQKRRN